MLEYTEFGAPTAPPLMIIHGLYGSGRNWGVIAKRLADSARIFTVDLRNHGNSGWTDTHSYPDMADDIAELTTHLGRPMHVLGHSMGGKAAMLLALNHPDMVDRLIVADIAPASYTHSQMPFIDAMRAVDLTNVMRRSEAEEQLAALGVEPALCSFFTQSLDVPNKRWKLNLDTLATEMPKIMSFPEVSGHFAHPTLFLTGANSDYVTHDHRPKIKLLFPAAHFAKIPDSGHWLHAEQPRKFEASVRAFLGLAVG